DACPVQVRSFSAKTLGEKGPRKVTLYSSKIAPIGLSETSIEAIRKSTTLWCSEACITQYFVELTSSDKGVRSASASQHIGNYSRQGDAHVIGRRFRYP